MGAYDQKAMYYRCPKCKKWVPATRNRCECGQNLTNQRPQFLPEEQRQEDMPKMRCTGCQDIFYTYARECPVCHGILTVVPPKEEPEEMSGEEEWDELSGSVETRLLDMEDEEEEEEKAKFYFSATRYEKGFPIKSRILNIPIDPRGTVLGRILFTTDDSLFFHGGSREIDAHYSHISRYNAVLVVEGEHLYVSYYQDGGRAKTPVYVNQEKLGADERRELRGGDILRFGGSKKGSDKTIEVEIVADEWAEKPASADIVQEPDVQWRNQMQDFMATMDRQMRETQRSIADMNQGLTKMQGELQVINRAVAEINLADLHIRDDESAESYEERLSIYAPDTSPEAMREYIGKFLSFALREGTEKYNGLFRFFDENEMRRKGIFYAVFYEEVCQTAKFEDYEGPMGFLGRTMEGFVMGEVADIIKAANPGAYQNKVSKSPKGRMDLGSVLILCKRNVIPILRRAGYNSGDEKRQEKLEKALDVLDEVRKQRNAASHSSPDTLAASTDKAVTKERYEETKRMLLESYAIETMHDLYLRIKGGRA